MNRFLRATAALALSALLGGCGMVEVIPKEVDRGPVTPEISNTLLSLVDIQEQGAISSVDYTATSLGVISTLGTPAGFRLRLRYQELGVSLVEALKMSRDPNLLSRLVELAQWSNGNRVRAEALITLANFNDPNDYTYFQNALRDQDIGVRFASVEAVQQWAGPGSSTFLRDAMTDAWSPMIRVFAAQATLSQGNQEGLAVLYNALDDRSWIVRALAARYLGDYAPSADASKLLSALNRENRNDFVMAELAIATLKLLEKQTGKPVAAPPTSAAGSAAPSAGAPASLDNAISMEPLVLRPPRLGLPETTVAQTINQKLELLIQQRISKPMDPTLQQDSNYQDLNRLVTPEGFALQTRYSNLSVAVAEGLAGTKDPILRADLRRIAEGDSNPVARATALVSMAYAREDEDVTLIRTSLSDADPIVRFGAMEASEVGRFKVVPALQAIAATDPVPAFRLFAVQVLLSLNEASAYNDLVSNLDNEDWPARAMAIWYLGRYGKDTDYTVLLNSINREKNPFVLAEIALAVQRLAPPGK